MVSRKRMVMGGIGAVVVAALAVFALEPWHETVTPAQQNAARGAAPTEQAQALSYADEVTPPTPLQNDQIVELIGATRRLARDGKFDEAEASLKKAEAVAKSAPQIGQARDEIARLKTPEGRLAVELVRARLAVEHGDKEAAAKSLAEIEKIKPDAPQLAELRQMLQQHQARIDRRDDRIKEHLVAMRAAAARGDFSTADSELNAAARIDVSDPSVRQARTELARAYDDSRKKEARQ